MLAFKVLETLKRYGMVRRSERILVAVSGGPDSVVLAHVLAELRARLDAELVLAHLNHGLRAAAEDDEAFCRELAEQLGSPFASDRIDVARAARDSKRSLEDAGRRLRYRFLEDRAKGYGCDRIAVGHTLDDQAETFLLRLLRGSGARGLASVYPVVDGIRIRPLIETTRAEVLRYLEGHGLSYREDETNRDLRFTRNRLRADTIPRLAREFNPKLKETLAATAALLRDEEDWMESEADRAFETLVRERAEALAIDVSGLLALHPALRRRLVRRGIASVRGHLKGIGRVHIEDALALLGAGKGGREAHLPGVTVERSFGELRIRASAGERRHAAAKPGYNGFEYRLEIPTRLHIPESGGTLTARLEEPWRPPDSDSTSPDAATRLVTGGGSAVIVGIEGRLSKLRVRNPRPGDRFRPLGSMGTKPLTRYLMERKVDRRERPRIPLVVRADEDRESDEILWVAGHGVAEASRWVAGRTRLHLEWMRT